MSGAAIAVLVYLAINVFVMLCYGWDKHKAVAGKWRTKESTLIALGFIGAWGAVIGMKVFHHKTLKPKFKLNYLFLVLHVIGIIAVLCFYHVI